MQAIFQTCFDRIEEKHGEDTDGGWFIWWSRERERAVTWPRNKLPHLMGQAITSPGKNGSKSAFLRYDRWMQSNALTARKSRLDLQDQVGRSLLPRGRRKTLHICGYGINEGRLVKHVAHRQKSLRNEVRAGSAQMQVKHLIGISLLAIFLQESNWLSLHIID